MSVVWQSSRFIGALGAAVFLVPVVNAQNLAVYRVGDGSAALTNAATASFINQYQLDGSVLSSITIPSSGGSQLTNSGTATSEGALARSPNGLSLTFGGYDAAAGLAAVVSTTAAANPRVVGQIDTNGTYSRIGSFAGAFNANNIRGAVGNGTNYWAVGANTGVVLQGATPATIVSSTVANSRAMNIFSDQLYFSTGSGASRGIYAVGTGLPTSSGTPSTVVINTGGSSSNYGFQVNTAGNVAYIADDSSTAGGGGVQKWTWNGATWSLATLPGPVNYIFSPGSNIGARGLTVDWSNPATPVLYATTTETSANRLVKFTDPGTGFSAGTNLATAAANTAFRGVDFTNLPATWTNNTAGTQSFTLANTSTSGFSNAYRNWNVGLADGNILSFQNVNSTGGSLAINPDNNSALTNVAKIQFTGSGYGTNTTDKTAYTLTGNALTLNGGGGAGADISNTSGITQAINLPLNLSASRTIDTNSGNLNIGGAIGGAGGLTKIGPGILTLSGNNNYAGTTTINAGTLSVNGSNTGGSAFTVNSNGTLGGTGTISADVNVNGGTIAPGNSPGRLTVNGNVTFSAASFFNAEINGATTAGTDYDQLRVGRSGSLNLGNASLTLALGYTPANTDIIFLADDLFAGAINGTFSGLAEGATVNVGGGYTAEISYLGDFDTNATSNGNDVVLFNFTLSAVPEPSTYALLGVTGMSGTGVWFYRRRRVNQVQFGRRK